MRKKHILIRCPAETYTGYGILCLNVIRYLAAHGWRVDVQPLGVGELFGQTYPADIKALFTTSSTAKWQLLFNSPGPFSSGAFYPDPKRRTAHFTMWESTELAQDVVNHLNKADLVIVPSSFCHAAFSSSEVKTKLSIVPLGIDPNVFHYRLPGATDNFTFGCAGRMHGFKERKRINDIFDIFTEAFPCETTVRLVVKVFPDCEIRPFFDTRITVTRAALDHEAFANWLKSIHCLVNLSTGEGWGLVQQEAQAIGRPIITAYFGGITEFTKKEHCSSVHYSLRSAPNPPKEFLPMRELVYKGKAAFVNRRDLIKQMRYAYEHQQEIFEKGFYAAKDVQQFTWERTGATLAKTLLSL